VTSESIRVFLVDDHDVVRRGVRAYIEDEVEIVGEADEVDAAIELIRERNPDVVLLDVNLPGGGGHRVLQEVTATDPDIRFLALTVSESPRDVVRMIRAGAMGYVTKDVLGYDLVDKIRSVHEGVPVVTPRLAAFAVEAFDGEVDGLDPELDQLTPRERQAAVAVAKGYTNKQIAVEMDVSPKTVEHHVSSVLRKLQMTNRAEVTRWAVERGMT
jgi:DNA-binding NarL/FixJ family response regulator